MPRNDLLRNLESSLGEGVEEASAPALIRSGSLAARIIGYAVIRRSAEDLRAVENILAHTHTELLVKNGWSPEPDLKALAWMLAAAAKIASVVASMLPNRLPALDREQGTKKTAILMTLLASNTERLSNSDLVEKVDARPETVARVLETLRRDGLVKSWRRGRTTLNKLTTEGEKAAHEARERHDRLNTSQPPQETLIEAPFLAARARFARDRVPPTVTQVVAAPRAAMG